MFANVTAVPKGAPSPDRENYHPISITPILSKVYEKLVSHNLSSVCQKYGNYIKFDISNTFSVLLRCYYAFIPPILVHCSQVWGLLLNVISVVGSAAECNLWCGVCC